MCVCVGLVTFDPLLSLSPSPCPDCLPEGWALLDWGVEWSAWVVSSEVCGAVGWAVKALQLSWRWLHHWDGYRPRARSVSSLSGLAVVAAAAFFVWILLRVSSAWLSLWCSHAWRILGFSWQVVSSAEICVWAWLEEIFIAGWTRAPLAFYWRGMYSTPCCIIVLHFAEAAVSINSIVRLVAAHAHNAVCICPTQAATKEVEKDFDSVYSRLVLCKTYRWVLSLHVSVVLSHQGMVAIAEN